MHDQGKNQPRRTVLLPVVLILFLSWQWFGSSTQGIATANPIQQGDPAMTFTISSAAFAANGKIPVIHTCDGKDISPALSWSRVAPSCKSLALIVDDPDAPDPAAPRMTWIHWVLYNIPPSVTGLAQGASNSLPPGASEGINDWKRTGYGGPCPPMGTHRYFFKLYALDAVLPDLDKPSKVSLLKAMQGHIIEQTKLIGTYHR